MTAPERRSAWRRLGSSLAAGLIAWGCALSPSPDIPNASDDGLAPGAGGFSAGSGGASPSGGAAPCLLVATLETWCEGDDLWVRSVGCQGERWSVSPCGTGCLGEGEMGATCAAETLGVGGLGGQPAGDP